MLYQRRVLTIFALLVASLGPAAAFGGVETTSYNSRLKILPNELPGALSSGEWSLLVWVYATEAVIEPGSLMRIGGALTITADSVGVKVRARHGDLEALLELDSPLAVGRWHLLAVSMDALGGQARAWLATEASGGPGTIVSAGRNLGPAASGPVLTPDVSGLTVGYAGSGSRAIKALYEALVIRDHPLADTDVATIWEGRDYYSLLSLDTRDQGGLMSGWQGCVYMTFHAMSPGATGSGSGSTHSYVGGPVTTSNLIVLDQLRPLDQGLSSAFRIVGAVSQAEGLVYRSRVEPEFDGFFSIRPAPFDDIPTEPVGGLGPKASTLASDPQGLVRVMVSANSRGTRGSLSPQPWPENFAHGFVQALLPKTAGVLMRPATLLDSRGGWFGLDTSLTTPHTTLFRIFHTRTDGWADFTRFGTGTLPGASRGPGPATNISPGGEFRLRCGPVLGSLLVADAPLVVRSTVLAFPGSSELEWYPERGFMQNGEGIVLGDVERMPLDTTRVARELGADDEFVSDTELIFNEQVDVRVGDAIVVMNGSGRGSVSVVVGVQSGAETTTVQLSHPFGVRPLPGVNLRIGPWRFESVEHRFDAVDVSDDRNWRGQVLRSVSDANIGVMVYAISAWRPDVDGFVFGTAGQGGNGYTPQLANAFPGATEAWAQETQADVWIQGIAGQSSSPSAMLDYLAVLRAGLGADAEIIWASDAVHAHATHENWHDFLRDNAEDAGVPAIFAVGHPRVGSYFEQAASGLRTDDAHFSSFGDKIIAEAWLEQLGILAAGDTCALADYNLDGVVDAFDLIDFQTDWEARDPRADLDGDGQFTLFDFLVLLTAIDQCV